METFILFHIDFISLQMCGRAKSPCHLYPKVLSKKKARKNTEEESPTMAMAISVYFLVISLHFTSYISHKTEQQLQSLTEQNEAEN